MYFQVEDTDATIEKAKEQGGRVVSGPFDTPVGRTQGYLAAGMAATMVAPSVSKARG
jgi:predicted enzyme related to lactoylglutathione lyase